jgi:SulP family sulfate permease
MESNLPKSILWLRQYNLRLFTADLIAGVTVGLVALPLAMAFAIASGVPPQSGIYCAIITGFMISALGGSRFQIGGPTGAFVVVVSGIVAKYGVDGLHICTLMAGAMIALLGLTGLGSAVKFIPRPVVIGFTNGIAVLIASTQIKDFFGLRIDKVPGEFLGRAQALAAGFHTFSLTNTLLAAATLAAVLITPRITKKVPGYIVGLGGATAFTLLMRLSVDTIGSRFGGIPNGLPHFEMPVFRGDLIGALIAPALTVAMLGAIESLMSAVVADQMSGDQHNPNVELVAQGAANMVSPLFGGLPATGAIARTATNIRSGAQTPVSGMLHALTLLAILLFAAPLARFIPLAALAAILFVVAWNMGEWREIPELLKLSTADRSVWLVTFGLTVFADLTLAVEVGMILAALLYIRKVTATTTVTEVTADDLDDGRVHILQDKQIPDYVAIFRIHGPFLFGATDKISEVTGRIDQLPPIVVLRLRNMTAIDATGLHAIERLSDKLHESDRTLILCGAREQPAKLMRQANFERHVGPDNICPNVQAALDRARDVYFARIERKPESEATVS